MFLCGVLLLSVILVFMLFRLKEGSRKIINDLSRRDFIFSNLIDALEEGFYFCDLEKRTEQFSPNLQILLNTVFYSFDELSDFFEESMQLRKVFSDASQINQSFSLDLKAKEAEIYCIGYGRSVIDESNKVIGIILWIRNITSYKLQILSLECKSLDLGQELVRYRDTIDSIPYPIWRRGGDLKIDLYNNFYSSCIKDNKTKEVSDAFANERKIIKGQITINDHLIINDERRLYSLVEFLSKSYDEEFVGYGVDITQSEGLSNELNVCISAQYDIFNNISSAISIYGSDGKMQFYNNAFKDLWSLSSAWLSSSRTYRELSEVLYESHSLTEESFNMIIKQQQEGFDRLSETYHDFLYFKNGNILKLLIVPYTFGRAIFVYETISKKN